MHLRKAPQRTQQNRVARIANFAPGDQQNFHARYCTLFRITALFWDMQNSYKNAKGRKSLLSHHRLQQFCATRMMPLTLRRVRWMAPKRALYSHRIYITHQGNLCRVADS